MDYPPSDNESEAEYNEVALVKEMKEYAETVAQDPSMLIGHLKMETAGVSDERAASVLVKAIIDVSDEAESSVAEQVAEQSDNLLYFTQTYAKSSTDKSNAETMILIAFEQLLAETQTLIAETDAIYTALYEEDVVADEDAIINWCTDLESAIALDVSKEDAKRVRAAASKFADRFVDSDSDDNAED